MLPPESKGAGRGRRRGASKRGRVANKLLSRGRQAGGQDAGGGVRRKINPRGIAMKMGRMAKEWEIISATCSSRLRCRRVAEHFCSWPGYSSSSAPQGARRGRLPEMKEMPTQCVRATLAEIRPKFAPPRSKRPNFRKAVLNIPRLARDLRPPAPFDLDAIALVDWRHGDDANSH